MPRMSCFETARSPVQTTTTFQYGELPLGSRKDLAFFVRQLFLPDSHLKFIQGNTEAFDQGETEASKNKYYVALTKAQYSVVIFVLDKLVSKCNVEM